MVALITGGAGGIGRAVAKELGGRGFAVCFSYNTSNGEEFAQELAQEGIYSRGVRADFSVAGQGREFVRSALAHMGRIDVLVNNAGISQTKLFSDTTDEEWQRMFDVNVRSAYECTHEALPALLRQKRGSVINISSIWGVVGGATEVAYSASKSALIGYTRALAKELAPSNIRVNCVAPGLIDTEMNAHLDAEEYAEFCAQIPMGRAGLPGEVAKIVGFFASSDSSYITGQVLNADGGLI